MAPIHERILMAARQLFARHGLQKVTMDDVAKAMDMGRSSLYYYYKNKEEVLEAVMAFEIKQILGEVAKAVDHAETTEGKLRAFCLTKLQATRKRRERYETLEANMEAEEKSSYTRSRQKLTREFKEQEIALVRRILNLGIGAGEISLPDPDTFIFVFLSSLQGLKKEFVHEKSPRPLAPTVDAFIKLIMHGIKQSTYAK
jgi:AcrR family transcriptional regulator